DEAEFALIGGRPAVRGSLHARDAWSGPLTGAARTPSSDGRRHLLDRLRARIGLCPPNDRADFRHPERGGPWSGARRAADHRRANLAWSDPRRSGRAAITRPA